MKWEGTVLCRATNMKEEKELLCGGKQLKRGRHCTVQANKYDLKEGIVKKWQTIMKKGTHCTVPANKFT